MSDSPSLPTVPLPIVSLDEPAPPPPVRRLPPWLRQNLAPGGGHGETAALVAELGLETVCSSAKCPNRLECWSQRTATFMILGNVCTRPCGFCSVPRGKTEDLEADEPERVAEAARRLGLAHVVITSVTRDDLADGGAEHFRRTVEAVRAATGATIEVLVPDFLGKEGALETLMDSRPEVFNHNTETVPRLYRQVRGPKSDYRWTLELLQRVKQRNPAIKTKSGLMLGMGETREEVLQVMDDMRSAGVDFITIGQYLQPTLRHAPVDRFVTPDEFESYATEIGFVLDEISTHIRHLKNWSLPKRSATPITSFPASSFTINEPLGNVLIIAPWNYPFQLLIAPLTGAISAGNTAILKPSEISSNTANLIEEIFNNIFDPGLIRVIKGDKNITRSLLTLKFNHIFFTGSPRVGKIVMKAAAENLTPVTLELGGKSPCIVDENINVKLTAKRIIWGKLVNAGQTCISPDYILVNKNIKDKLIEEMKRAILRFYGENILESNDYPRIISKPNVERLAALISDKEIVYGGTYDVESRYFEPTIIDNISPEDTVMQQEIFGPILPIITYSKLEEVIEFVNNRPKPLALYFFSRCKRLQKRIVKDIPAGGVTINDTVMHFANNNLPFGGVGNSGTGKYHGKHSFLTFSNAKPVVYKKTWLDVPIRYAPFGRKVRLLKYLLR